MCRGREGKRESGVLRKGREKVRCVEGGRGKVERDGVLRVEERRPRSGMFREIRVVLREEGRWRGGREGSVAQRRSTEVRVGVVGVLSKGRREGEERCIM